MKEKLTKKNIGLTILAFIELVVAYVIGAPAFLRMVCSSPLADCGTGVHLPPNGDAYLFLILAIALISTFILAILEGKQMLYANLGFLMLTLLYVGTTSYMSFVMLRAYI